MNFQGLEEKADLFSKAWKTAARVLALAAFAVPWTLLAEESALEEEAPETDAPAVADLSDGAPELWFPVGEELVYRIYWGALPVGESRMTSQWVEVDGRRLLRLRLRSRSNKIIATVYPVDSVIESDIDPETFLPVRFLKNLKEGRHRYHETTTFDWEKMEAHWVSHLRGKEQTFVLEPDTRDLPSFMYWARRDGIRPGETMKTRVMADEKIYDLEVQAGRVEKIRLNRYGKISSVKVEPKAAFQGLAYRRSKIWMWVSQDPRHLSTQVSVEVPVARVHLMLHDVRGPGDDFWVKKKK